MTELAEHELIAELARGAVREVAPRELPRFRLTSAAYFEDPERVLAAEAEGDLLLGFGDGPTVQFLTPIVLAVSTQVVRFLADEVGKSLKEESPAAIQEVVKRMLKRFRPADGAVRGGEARPADEASREASAQTTPTLTLEQLARLREVAYETARRMSLAESKASLLADSIIGGMAVSAPGA